MSRPAEPSGGPPAPLVIVGPTASGKSAVAMALARRWGDGEIVSVDSMQVYRGMDIGTAKPSLADRAEVPHHLIDVLDPWQSSSVAWFQEHATQAMAAVTERRRRPVLVGGTGLYHRAVIDQLTVPGEFPDVAAALDREPDTSALWSRLRDLDPVAAARMEPTNRRRVVRALEVTVGSGRPFSSFGPGLERYSATHFRMVGLALERPNLTERIERRVAEMVAAGLLDEARRLLEDPRGVSRTARQALGYRELFAHLTGEMAFDETIELIKVRTRQFAVRQQRWFRRDPRIVWIDAESPDLVERVAGTVEPP